MIVDRLKILALVLSVMVLDSIKLSKWFSYSFVDRNHLLNFSDPLAKKKEAANKNGVVGKTGNTTPITPIAKNKNARIIYTNFFILYFITFISPSYINIYYHMLSNINKF